ncbi:MotA/TolQ/ExbB proton channel family protein [bacterium]|nr:MotA/TolQ/ExbB proton channel family protein [bacterium]
MNPDTTRMKQRFQQANTWLIIILLAGFLVFSIFNQALLDSDWLSAKLTPAVKMLGYVTNFLLYATMIVMIVNYAYVNMFKVARVYYYNGEQREQLVKLLKDPNLRGDFYAFKEKSHGIVHKYPNYLSEIVASLIPTALEQPFVLEQYFRAKVDNISGRFADQINTITLMSNVAPILGFLGTLLGLIKAFYDSGVAMQVAGQMTPEDFAKLQSAIQIAIITSLWGVAIKVVGSIMRHHITIRASRFADEVAEIPREVMYS